MKYQSSISVTYSVMFPQYSVAWILVIYCNFWSNIFATFWKHFGNIFSTFWQNFANILATFLQ